YQRSAFRAILHASAAAAHRRQEFRTNSLAPDLLSPVSLPTLQPGERPVRSLSCGVAEIAAAEFTGDRSSEANGFWAPGLLPPVNHGRHKPGVWYARLHPTATFGVVVASQGGTHLP